MTEATKKKITKWFWICLTAPILMVIGLLALVWAFADIPSFEELENPDSKLATQVIAEDGEILTTFHIENRSYVTFDELSPNLVNAAIATEDVRFHNHSGIDFRALARVVFKTLLGGNSGQGGGSTITQQLAKTLYPREDMGGSKFKMVWTKLKEWVTAVKLERSYTKDEIMNMYMNQVFFGSNAYGIKAAAQTFFGKAPIDLTVEEAATLVGMVNKPTRYNPALKLEGKNPFSLDSKAPTASYIDFIKSENRYSRLAASNPERANELFAKAEEVAKAKYEKLNVNVFEIKNEFFGCGQRPPLILHFSFLIKFIVSVRQMM